MNPLTYLNWGYVGDRLISKVPKITPMGKKDCEEISNREPEDRLPYEGYGCGYVEMIELCCVIIPLVFSFILLLMRFKGKVKEE